MADLAQGYTADVMLMPGDSVRVSTVGQATVRSAYGAPAGTNTLNANTQTFGPYGVPAKLTITAVSGTANYVQPTQVPVTYDPSTGIVNSPGAVSGAGVSYPANWVRNTGQLICDWRGTLSGTGYSLDATASCPAGTAVIGIAGDATTDGTGNPGNNACTMSFTAASSVGLQTVGVWMCVAKRNSARKNYRNVPVKLLLSVDNTFAKFFTLGWNARADGKWHYYILDVAYASNSGFTFGTDTIGCARVRASIDTGVTASALTGTAPLQVGETAFFGGITLNPRGQAMALVRFDDMMINLYSRKDWVVASQYSGVSGVVVPAGSYSAYDLLNFYGLVGSCFILTKYLNNGGSQYFESIPGLQALQNAGWEICAQTHANPVSASNLGARLLGPAGINWFAQAVNNHATDGTVTTIAVNDIAAGTGQGTPVTLTGTPPAPLAAGGTYWIRAFSTTTAKFYPTEADSLANTNAITFPSAGAATWGWSFAGATSDATAINNEFATMINAMKAAGLNGWMHWAPNQGAFDATMEEAFYANGMASGWSIGYGPLGQLLGVVSQSNPSLVLNNYISHLPTFAVTLDAYGTDAGGATEANARAFVQKLCKYGAIGQNYHHNANNVPVLLAYLDELKYRQDRGEIVVTTPSKVVAALKQLRLDA